MDDYINYFVSFITWLRDLAPWWGVIIALPIVKIIWDSLQDKFYNCDRRSGKSVGISDRRRNSRIFWGNLVIVCATLVCTILATSEAYKVDQDTKAAVTSNSNQLNPSEKDSFASRLVALTEELDPSKDNTIAYRLKKVKDDLHTQKTMSVSKTEFAQLEKCAKQVAEKLGIDDDCFPD